jgi:hypothetical protein
MAGKRIGVIFVGPVTLFVMLLVLTKAISASALIGG